MTRLIFVHGTGGRQEEYAKTFQVIEDKLKNLNSGINLVPCLWGEYFGTRLNANGASIPNYSDRGGTAHQQNQERYLEKIWEELYKNPLYEIFLLSLKPPQAQSPFNQQRNQNKLIDRLERLTNSDNSEQLINQLRKVEIDWELFKEAVNTIRKSSQYQKLLETGLNTLDEIYAALARAIVATVIELCDRDYLYTQVEFDPELRDQTVKLITDQLSDGDEEKGIGDFLFSLGFNLTDKPLQQNWGALSDKFNNFIGDILFYQARGKEIRTLIQEVVNPSTDPVILLGHSLGGIACVELLIEQQLPQVQLLVTVGSQAPFFYEIDVLQTLRYGHTLPEKFPKWLNIYDERDMLSYIGANLFPNRITDVPVNNQQPFPKSHGAYWYNSQTWDAILETWNNLHN
jgi:hypothetical protein